ncbi:MAG TPA: DNA-formamidopyrimidine glycosylase family protein [Acidimicrobiales bacterium]|nr:DNA-formamidopyrimidine glycosylase family protein [Acidimicrobiales bacterium]
MPELPEVESLALFLAERLEGRTVTRAELGALSALKTYAPPLSALVGGTVKGTGRRGKHLLISIDDLVLVMHLARGGWVQWREQLTAARAKPGKGPLALRMGFDDGSGFDVTEQGTEKRLALWVVQDPSEIERVAALGPDPLSPGFALAPLLAGRRAQIKGVLTDQAVIAGIGNAYSDEALHIAKLSPFRMATTLSADEVARLEAAIVSVLSDAVARSAGLPAGGLKTEKKSGMRVHGRTGQPCPECGDTVREVSFATTSLQYCPTCQTGGKPLADRRLSRLLK